MANRDIRGHLNMTIPEDLKLRFGQIACERDMSISALARLLIREEIDRYERQKACEPGNRGSSRP